MSSSLSPATPLVLLLAPPFIWLVAAAPPILEVVAPADSADPAAAGITLLGAPDLLVVLKGMKFL